MVNAKVELSQNDFFVVTAFLRIRAKGSAVRTAVPIAVFVLTSRHVSLYKHLNLVKKFGTFIYTKTFTLKIY